jgi:hypothetical protein
VDLSYRVFHSRRNSAFLTQDDETCGQLLNTESDYPSTQLFISLLGDSHYMFRSILRSSSGVYKY